MNPLKTESETVESIISKASSLSIRDAMNLLDHEIWKRRDAINALKIARKSFAEKAKTINDIF